MSLRDKAREIAKTVRWCAIPVHAMSPQIEQATRDEVYESAERAARAAMVAALEWARQEFGVRLDDYEHDVMRKKIEELKRGT